MILYRPVGLQELELIYESGMKAFPARLPQRPVFYPVLQLEYARQIASDWNAKSGGSAGYVTQFRLEDSYIAGFEKHTVRGSQYQELWIPAEEVEEFNKHITGHIQVVEAHFGDAFQGFIPEGFDLQGKNAIEQFTLLTNSYLYQRMDFYREIRRSHKAIFLNYPFWQTYEFKNPGLKEKIIKAIKEAWLTSFPQIPLPSPFARQTDAHPQHVDDPGEEEFTSEEQTDSDEDDPVQGETMTEEEADAHMYKRRLANSVHEKFSPLKQTYADSLVEHPIQEDVPHAEPARSAVPTNPRPQADVSPVHVKHSQGIRLGLSGRYQEAIAELSRAVEEEPDDVAVPTSLGVAFHRLDEDDRALACYETALKIDPIYAEAHYFRANILYSRGNVREAIAGYTIAIGLKPELIEAHLKPSPADRLTDYRPSLAEMVWIAKPAHRILDLNKSLESNPGESSLFKERAAEYYRLRNYSQAIADYTSALELEPDDANVLHSRGVAYEGLGQNDRALEDYQRALAINPQLSDVYLQRGITFGQMGNLRQSIASLTEGLRLAPENPDGYFNRGVSYFQLGDLEKAIEDLSTVIRLFPGDEAAYYWRGISNEEAGHQSEATADYRKFLELSQDADARDEIEAILSQWQEGKRDDPGTVRDLSVWEKLRGWVGRRGVVPEERQNTDQVPSENPEQALDLYDLIAALGDRALNSIWLANGVECYGESAEELYALTGQNQPIEGGDLLAISAGIRQTIAGEFQAFDPGGTTHWIFIRAWDGNGFYMETDDTQIEQQLKTHFPAMEEVEGAEPPYEGLFIRI
jgi:tetratricopeptide (TPR) repeat protein